MIAGVAKYSDNIIKTVKLLGHGPDGLSLSLKEMELVLR
jgi:hypothetical protein